MSTESHPELTEAVALLQEWVEHHNQQGFDPIPILVRLAEIVEAETENYMKMDPDPFDDRHPSRADPACPLGQILKVLFRKELFMSKLVNDYLRDNYWERLGMPERDSRQLNIIACRLVLDVMPGLEASAVFQQELEGLINRLYSWAEKASEPLQSYATGLLASAMEVQDIAANFREQNAKLVPLMLQRLHKLQSQMVCNQLLQHSPGVNGRPFAHLGTDGSKLPNGDESSCVKWGFDEGGGAIKILDGKKSLPAPKRAKGQLEVFQNGIIHDDEPRKENSEKNEFEASNMNISSSKETKIDKKSSSQRKPFEESSGRTRPSPAVFPSPESTTCLPPATSPVIGPQQLPTYANSECSNSSWAEMESYVIGHVQMYPPTLATRQILILRYLAPMGEYQEFLSHVFEHNALELILKYINVRETRDARLAFEALKYLAALLCHKKFSIEFINMQGLQKLLEVPRPSITATGVSMCLYYLAYCEDAIERVCILPRHLVSDLVRYALWLLECSHDSGRCHATMFFGLTFQFRVILEEFDAQDGLRKLYNVVSTLPILSVEEDTTFNEDEECAARQIVRHVCMALKRYFEAHLAIKSEQVKRASLRDQPMSPPASNGDQNLALSDSPPMSPPFYSMGLVTSSHIHSQAQSAWPPYKAMKWSAEEVQTRVSVLLELLPFRAHWAPVEELLRLGGVNLLLQIIAFAYEWNYSGRGETVRSALDVLAVCCVMPRVQSVLCERVELPEESMTVGLNIVLGAAEGEIVADPDVQRAALNVIANCVCAPISRVGGLIGRYSIAGSSRKRTFRSSEELIGRVWEGVRANNGIMVLLQLMTVKTPITDADSLRALACRAMAGLARSETVRQIISKLPMFSAGQILTLMRDPILQDKRQEHVKFQKHALELLERVSGKAKAQAGNDTHFDISLNNIHRANVVAQTKITFNEKQLIQLIYMHLASKGFRDAASNLQREAGLLPFPSTPRGSNPSHDFPPFSYRGPASQSTPSAMPTSPSTPLSSRGTRQSAPSTQSGQSTANVSSSSTMPLSPFSAAATVSQPIRVNFSNSRKLERTFSGPGSLVRSLEKQTTTSPMMASSSSASSSLPPSHSTTSQFNLPLASTSFPIASPPTSNQLALSHHNPVSCMGHSVYPPPDLSLDSIITEYLMNQHALCKNPMTTCPQFNLFEPHKCPDPKMRNVAPANVAMRVNRRSIHPPRGGFDAGRLDRRLVHSRFCPVRSFRLVEDDGFFTCCQFLSDNRTIVMGTYQGEVKLFNLHTAVEESSYQCHDSYVYHMAVNREGNLLLTSSTWRRPLSALWSIDRYIDNKYPFEEEEYVEFSKLTQDRVIGTKGETANIYDLATGKQILSLFPMISNQYTKNRATFSPTDELVLSDGVLWDISTGKKIHKFDKLNQTLSGVFHPNGLEVVSNTEVWDLRTFHLLRTVPSLEQSEVMFAPGGGVSSSPTAIYTVSVEQEEDPSFETSFKTLDAYDFSSIATIDVKRNIYYLCINRFDTQIAIVENMGMFDSVQESTVRLYDVGRRKDDEDEGEEEEEEDEDMDGASEDATGSGSDNEDEDDDDDDDDDEDDEDEEEDDDDNDDDDGENFDVGQFLEGLNQGRRNEGDGNRRLRRRGRRRRRRRGQAQSRGGANANSAGTGSGAAAEASVSENAANDDNEDDDLEDQADSPSPPEEIEGINLERDINELEAVFADSSSGGSLASLGNHIQELHEYAMDVIFNSRNSDESNGPRRRLLRRRRR